MKIDHIFLGKFKSKNNDEKKKPITLNNSKSSSGNLSKLVGFQKSGQNEELVDVKNIGHW